MTTEHFFAEGVVASGVSTIEPTFALQWVNKDGGTVLQQAFRIINYEGGVRVDSKVEWRDIPTVDHPITTIRD